MAAQTWSSIKTALLVELSQAPPPYNVVPPDFDALMPQATSYAEERIYREMIPLNQRNLNTSLSTGIARRTVDLSATSQIVLSVERFGLIYPSSVTDPTLGSIQYYDAASLDVIDLIWPDQTQTVDPTQATWLGRYWAMLDDHTIVFSPCVAAAYTIALTGNFTPIPISETNPATYLSTNYSGLLIAACMIYMTGALLRNYGSQSDDPRMALSWNSQYQDLLTGAILEEKRRRMEGAGWSQNPPNPIAKPDRS